MSRVAQRETVGMRTMQKGPRQNTAPAPTHWRPKTRSDCSTFIRPCPFLGCRYHLALDVNAKGGIRTFRDRDFVKKMRKMPFTCALDAAESGQEFSNTRIGLFLDVTRARVQQSILRTLRKLRQGPLVVINNEGAWPLFPGHHMDSVEKALFPVIFDQLVEGR